MRKNKWNLMLWAAFLVGSFLQILILLAVYKKGGGTTGGEPYEIVLPYALLFLLGMYAHVWRRNDSNRILSCIVIITGLFGCVLPYWLERTGSLVQYERWLHNNQSPNAENLGFSLVLFACAEVLALVGMLFWKGRKIAAEGEI
jgi:peptidoglycan/LPS O-acetylase OafA/YrhL